MGIIENGCLQCFDTVGWAAERISSLLKTKWWGADMVISLKRGAYDQADALATHYVLFQ